MTDDKEKQDSYIESMDEEDLYEELEDEELLEILRKERAKPSVEKKKGLNIPGKYQKIIVLVLAITLVVQGLAIWVNFFNIPALEFIKISHELSEKEEIQLYKKAVVSIDMQNSQGTGFNISPDGLIITNYHVIENGGPIMVTFPDGEFFAGEVVEERPDIDLAILEIEGENLPSLNAAPKRKWSEHEHVFFIGNPLFFTNIANEGEIIGETTLTGWEQPVLMLSAPVYKGNSGSPVINSNGEVIAVVFAKTRRDEYGNIGLAVPLSYFSEELSQFNIQN